MPQFSRISQERLATCHPDLIRLFREVVKIHDCMVLCGHRTEAEQLLAVRTGRSQKTWPKSKHNTVPSMAADVAPYPVDWNDRRRFDHFAGVVRGVAAGLGIKVRWGGDWDGDFDLKDQRFNDLPHFEIVE